MIYNILKTISDESSTNKKTDILTQNKDNYLLQRVLYMALSRKIKFYVKNIPDVDTEKPHNIDLDLSEALDMLEDVYKRKVTGNASIRHIHGIMNRLSHEDANVVYRIIQKDLKLGIGKTIVNKVFPKLIEDTPYMGALPYDRKSAETLITTQTCVSQTKMDGRYCNAIIRDGDVELESRQGEETILYGFSVMTELRKFPDCVLNGELTIDGIPRFTANGIIASIIDIETKRYKNEDLTKEIKKFESKHGSYESYRDRVVFTVWDCITVEEYFAFYSPLKYLNRFMNIVNMLSEQQCKNIRLVESRSVKTLQDALEHYTEMIEKGDEGTIIKSVGGVWKDGKFSFQQKVKKEEYYDLKIVGFHYGTKGTKNEKLISSVDVESSDGKLKVTPSNMKESMMKDITVNQDKYLGMIAEVKCSGLSWDSDGNYSLLHPVFIKVRDDKNVAQSLDECIAISKMNDSEK